MSPVGPDHGRQLAYWPSAGTAAGRRWLSAGVSRQGSLGPRHRDGRHRCRIGRQGRGPPFDNVRRTAGTNILGAVVTTDAACGISAGATGGAMPWLPPWPLSSVVFLPRQAAYCASKAALSIHTPINIMFKNRPFLISVEKSAHPIADRIEGDRVFVALGVDIR